MNYINTATLAQLSESEIRALNPNTSFPSPFIEPAGYAFIFPAPQPAYDAITQRVQAIAPELTTLGHWEQRWEVVARFVEYTDETGVLHTRNEQEAQAIAEAQNVQSKILQENIISATQARLDAFAATRNYDGILSACTYATSGIPKFAAEGQAAVNARDATWATLYTIMSEVQAGTRLMPVSFTDIEVELPVLVWPA